MGQVFINGQWVDDGKDGYFQAATGLRVGSQGVGSVATGYRTPPGLPTEPSKTYNIPPLSVPPDQSGSPDVSAVSEARYQTSRREAEKLQAIRARNALSDRPAGSPTSYLGASGQVLGSIEKDEFGIPKPAPRGNIGLRGYPTADEYAAGIARDAAQAKEDQFSSDINSVMGRYPAAPKFQAPTMDQMIDPLIERRRQAEANAVANLSNRLGSESDQPIPLGRGRYGPSPASQTRRELAMRSRNLNELDRSQQANISGRSRVALEAAKRNDLAAQDTARAQVVDLFSNIDESRYPHGSPDRDRFIGTVLGRRPDLVHAIVKDKFLGKFVQDHMEAHKTVGDTMQALQNQYGPNLKFTPTITAKGDVSYRGSIPAESKAAGIPKNAATRYAKVLGDITYHQGNQKAEEASNIKSNLPNTPYSEQAKFDAAQIERQQLEQQFPGLAKSHTKLAEGYGKALNEEEQRALRWTLDHPDDPRSDAIRERLGAK